MSAGRFSNTARAAFRQAASCWQGELTVMKRPPFDVLVGALEKLKK